MNTLLNLIRYLTENTKNIWADETQPHTLTFKTYDYNTDKVKEAILKKFDFHILDKANKDLAEYLLDYGVNLHLDTEIFEQIDNEYIVVWDDTYIYLVW